MGIYTPNESATDLFLERTLIAGDVICGLEYGIQFCLYSYCTIYLWKQRHVRGHAYFILAYITLIFVIETIFVVVEAAAVQLCYIDNRNFPGGPWQYFLSMQNQAVNVIFYATLLLITFLCDCLVLWRCWIIWAASNRLVAYIVVILPGLMIVASFIMGVLWTLQSIRPELSFYAPLTLAYGMSYYAISLSINIVLTALITLRLLQYRYRLKMAMPQAQVSHYLSVATVPVESAALYVAFSLAWLITYAVNSPTSQVWLTSAQAAQQISAYLIIIRLADGRAWKSDTIQTAGLVTMHESAGATLGPTTAAAGAGPSVYVTDNTKPYQLSGASSADSMA